MNKSIKDWTCNSSKSNSIFNRFVWIVSTANVIIPVVYKQFKAVNIFSN